jgi:hypothetical protein
VKLFENRVLREVVGFKRTEVAGDWITLHNKELHDMYSSPNVIWVIKSRRMRWVGHVACTGNRRGAYRVLVARPEGEKQLGGPRHR